MTTTDELLPCPFCGGKARIDGMLINSGHNDLFYVARVKCIECGATLEDAGRPSGYDGNDTAIDASVIKAWNSRIATLGDVPRLPHWWTHDGTLHVELPRLPESISVRLPDQRDREVGSTRVWQYTPGAGTCHEVEDEDTGFICCSECGAIHDESYTGYYCWCCGAKVVDG